jgi:hypothetical protein
LIFHVHERRREKGKRRTQKYVNEGRAEPFKPSFWCAVVP